jgi:hypothetical protein
MTKVSLNLSGFHYKNPFFASQIADTYLVIERSLVLHPVDINRSIIPGKSWLSGKPDN